MQKSTTRKLRIGFVVDDGMDRPDGVQQYILSLGRWLQKQGHSVCYLAGETKRTDIEGIIPMSRNIKVDFNGNRLSSPLPASKSKIKQVLAEQKPDVLHVQMPYSPFMAARVVRTANPATKIVGTFHVLPVGKYQSFGTKLLGYVLRRNLSKFGHFISVSKPAQAFAEQSFGIDSEVIPNPVDISKFKSAINTKKSSGLNIVFLGRLVPRKGCMQLLMTMNHLLKLDLLPLDTALHICGSGPQKQRLMNYVKKSGLGELTEFHGFVSEKDKLQYLANADFAIFPSTGGESFGIVLIEAMAAKAGVVLAGNNPGYASVMGSLDYCLFDPADPTALANKMLELMENHAKHKSIHEKQQQLVKRFDINTVGKQLMQIYES